MRGPEAEILSVSGILSVYLESRRRLENGRRSEVQVYIYVPKPAVGLHGNGKQGVFAETCMPRSQKMCCETRNRSALGSHVHEL